MKIRFQSNTLRLRLRRSDVERLLAEGVVSEIVSFPGGDLVYRLSLADEVAVAQAFFDGRKIEVRVPREQAETWGRGIAVGISSPTVVPTVLIEKDFVRTAVEEEDDYDRFTNPRSGRTPPKMPRNA